MPVVTTRQLLEAGVHFGHQTRRWNPKMKRFIFTERNGIYILDLQLTVQGIEAAYSFTRDLVASGGTILFVATKKQLQDALEEQAMRAGMPFVNFRWLGGMLTNFRTMHERIKRMRELEEMVQTGSIDAFPKKEQLKLTREYEKLARNLKGLKDIDRAPDAVFILDTKKEEIAIREAKKLGIPIVAILDTNSDPDDADYGIPGNDDAIRAGALLTRIIADAAIEGKSMRGDQGEASAEPASKKDPKADVLPGAAAEPKAEWELQLEAEEAAEAALKTTDEAQSEKSGITEGVDAKGDEPGDLSHPSPKEGGTETARQADKVEDTTASADPTATDAAGQPATTPSA
jgi:small subunit ribosomal protein S2